MPKGSRLIGPGRALARCVIRFSGLLTVLGVLAWGALGWWQWRATTRDIAQRQEVVGKGPQPSKAVQLRYWVFFSGAVGWWWLVVHTGKPFDTAARARVLGGPAVRRKLLWETGTWGHWGFSWAWD